MAKEVSIRVKLDKRTFVRFALFDAFIRKKRWKRPTAFSAILLAFAAVALFVSDHPQSALVVVLLTSVGLGLPLIYFFMYLSSVRRKARALKLDGNRCVYALRLTDDGVSVESAGEVAAYEWNRMRGAWRMRGCTCLYVSDDRAFILPDGRATVNDDTLWRFIRENMPEGRAHGFLR